MPATTVSEATVSMEEEGEETLSHVENGEREREGEREKQRGRERSSRKTKSRRGRRTKHRKGTEVGKNSSVLGSSGAEEVATEEGQTEVPLQNHLQPPEAAMATRGDGEGVANLPPAVSRDKSRLTDHGRVVESQNGGSEGGGGGGVERGKGGSCGGLTDFGMVRVKQEPQDDEMDTESGAGRDGQCLSLSVSLSLSLSLCLCLSLSPPPPPPSPVV